MQHIPDFEKDATAKLEIEGLSPALFQIQNQAQQELPIAEDMPSDYFDNLFDNVWSQLQEQPVIQEFKPTVEAETKANNASLNKRPIFWYAAASLALLVTCALGLTWNESNKNIISPQPLAQADLNSMLNDISVEEIASYLMDNSEDLDLRLLAVSDNAYNLLSEELIGNLHTDDSFHWDY